MESKTFKDMDLNKLIREQQYNERQIKHLYAIKKEIEKELDRRFEEDEL